MLKGANEPKSEKGSKTFRDMQQKVMESIPDNIYIFGESTLANSWLPRVESQTEETYVLGPYASQPQTQQRCNQWSCYFSLAQTQWGATLVSRKLFWLTSRHHTSEGTLEVYGTTFKPVKLCTKANWTISLNLSHLPKSWEILSYKASCFICLFALSTRKYTRTTPHLHKSIPSHTSAHSSDWTPATIHTPL